MQISFWDMTECQNSEERSLSYVTTKTSILKLFNELLGTQYCSHKTEGDEMNVTCITHEETQ